MKTSPLTTIALVALLASPLRAADDTQTAALRAADDARIAAVMAADANTLRQVLSDDLHYGHSSGPIDTKDSFIDSLVSGRAKYTRYEHEQRDFSFPAPGIALMHGRANVKVETAKGGLDSPIGYLAVWRLENGQWRFLAWQACRVVAPKP